MRLRTIPGTVPADNPDPASLRRFTFMLQFDYLADAGKVLFYRRMFAPFGVGGWANLSPKHSVAEDRFAAFGQTDLGRWLVVIYTLRVRLIRVISARDMNRKEREFYEHAKEE